MTEADEQIIYFFAALIMLPVLGAAFLKISALSAEYAFDEKKPGWVRYLLLLATGFAVWHLRIIPKFLDQ